MTIGAAESRRMFTRALAGVDVPAGDTDFFFGSDDQVGIGQHMLGCRGRKLAADVAALAGVFRRPAARTAGGSRCRI